MSPPYEGASRKVSPLRRGRFRGGQTTSHSRNLRDPPSDIVQPFKHLPIGKAQDSDPERLDITLALPIVLAGTGLNMAVPIDLNGELELEAVEVEHVGAYAVLPAKTIVQESAIAQHEPQALFGEGAVAAQTLAFLFVGGSIEGLGH
jgi:hypothetical protein